METQGGEEMHAVEGRSKESLEDALADAASQAYSLIGREALFDVVRQQVVVSNPRVSEYRVVLVPAPG